MDKRCGRYAMHSGQLIDIENFSPEMVHIEDIAHHLAKIQRFNGACPIDKTYSVGEHCINLANYFKDWSYNRKAALLHDASEAYLSDIVSPVKRQLKDYRALEEKVQNIIYHKYLGMNYLWGAGTFKEIGLADKRILIDEAERLMPDKLYIYKEETGLTGLGCNIEYNNHASTVKACYLKLCREYGLT